MFNLQQSQVIFALLFLMVLGLFFVYRYKPRSIDSCLVFCTYIYLFGLLDSLGFFNGYWYYVCAAGVDLMIINTLNHVAPSRTTYHLQRLCFVALVVNFIGWLMWFSYLPPTAYNAAFIVIYVTAVYVIYREPENNADGVFTIIGRRITISGNDYQSMDRFKKSQTQAGI